MGSDRRDGQPAESVRGSRMTGTARAVVALIAASLALAIVPASALANLWVSAGGTDTGYCSQANPCATISRAISLAIPNDTIYVGPGRFTDHVTVDPSISGLVLQGAGMHATTVSGGFNGTGSVITVQAQTTAEIDDLTITGGQAPNGGGVNTAGTLTMQRDEVVFNAATGDPAGGQGEGGGIYDTGRPVGSSINVNGGLTITDSVIESNQATTVGGGVASYQGTLARDLIDRNTVSAPPLGRTTGGGGVYSSVNAALIADTVVGNSVVDQSGNPLGKGGGVYDVVGGRLQSDTIVGNTAARGGGLGTGLPGDAYGYSYVTGTLLAQNRGGNCYVLFPTVLGLDDDGTCSQNPPLNGEVRNIVGQDPLLGPLADNGGPTQTMAITSASPAYDATTDCAGTDQRGVSQLQRGARQCDIGAYQVSAPTTYVANRSPASVTAYATGANGNAAPVLTLAGSATGMQQASGVATDTNGNVFVADPVANAISEFAPEANGNVAPIARIAGSATKLTKPADLAVDDSGRLYVSNDGAVPTITEYAPGASGNVAPVTSISGSAARLSNPTGIVIGPDGKLHVANDNATITTFSLGASGNAAPLSILRSSALRSPRGLNFDPSGQLIVASSLSGKALTYAAPPTATATATAQPTNTRSGLGIPVGLDLDLAGNLFVSDNKANRVLEYPPGQPTPGATITGSLTGLSAPAFLSELPPTPAPRLRLSAPRRQTRERLLMHGIAVRIRAFNGRAFRDRPVTLTVTARAEHTTIASARAVSIRPGTTTVRLRPTRQAPRTLARHRRTLITVTVTVHDAGGTQHHAVGIVSTG